MKKQLAQAAIECSNRFRERATHLKNSIADLELKTLEAKAHLEAANLAVDRLDSFRVEIGGQVQCPSCWIAQGVESSLSGQPSDGYTDWLKCRTCGAEYEIEP